MRRERSGTPCVASAVEGFALGDLFPAQGGAGNYPISGGFSLVIRRLVLAWHMLFSNSPLSIPDATINMKRLLWLLLFLCPLAAAAPGDEYVLAAREAARNGERVRLDRQLQALENLPGQRNVLEPWVRYWQLGQRIEDGGVESEAVQTEVAEFLSGQADSYLVEKLRGDWLRALGRRGLWTAFQRDYPLLAQPDQELACYELQGRLALQPDQASLDEVRAQWFAALDLPDSCLPLIGQLIAAGRINEEDVWARIRRLLEAKKLDQALQTARNLPQSQRPAAKTLASIADRPQRYLDRFPSARAAAKPRRVDRELALYAVGRLARVDAAAAAQSWQKIQDRFSAAERGYAWGQIAMAGARGHQQQALNWFLLVKDAPLSETQLAWQARAALRFQDWPMVQMTIERMPPKMAAQPDWIYWLGRAQEAQGRAEAARSLYLRISNQPNFYGMLASDQMGRPTRLPPSAKPLTEAEVAEAGDNPGLKRALALIRLGMRIEGVREWNWTLRGMDDRHLLAAAALAQVSEVFDRAISTADRTQLQHDYSLRYPAPFRDLVDPQARDLALDHGWVYGLMRQESRFVMNAKSGVGAKGLMQLMPATARWVAKKIGLKGYHPSGVAEMKTNVTLGTHYLSMVLAGLDNLPVLASAAYNAGPGRARQWRAEEPLEGAIYVETIPFSETRDYVKKVMTNAVFYSALFDDKGLSLKNRLGVVGPRSSARADPLP